MSLKARPIFASVLLGILVAALLATGPSTPSAEAGATGKKGSGGKAVAHHIGGAPIRSAKVTRKAPSARLYRPGLNSTEPTLGVTEDNEVFYSTFQSNTRIEVVRSSDEGKTWDIVSPKFPGGRNAQLLSLDPYVYVDNAEGANRVFTIDLTVACSYLSFSDDAGESWITNPLACGRPVNDHQTLFSGPPTVSPTVGYPNVVYYCWNDIATSACSKSLDGGLTFIPVTPAFAGQDPEAEEGSLQGQDADGFCGGLHGHGYVGEDGTLYVPRGYCGRPYLAISKDEGASWTRVRVSKTPISGHEASVATDSKGNIYYGWVGRDRRPYLTVSKNGGKTWRKAMMVGPPGLREANLPSLDVGAPGHVAFAYMGSENSPGPPFEEVGECTAIGACPDPDSYQKTTWNGYMMETHNALDKDPVLYTTTVNDKRDPLVRGTCGPGRCKAVYDFIDVVISPTEEVWSAWVDGCTLACSVPGATSNSGADGVVGRLVP
ncbi:MAG TPA: sialidase family protein [Actinomycetota bacterium]|nr:sialidase family protein [Actinomycetota bacterium]